MDLKSTKINPNMNPEAPIDRDFSKKIIVGN